MAQAADTEKAEAKHWRERATAAEARATALEQTRLGRAYCSHCEWYSDYQYGDVTDQARARAEMLAHARQCAANPLVQQLAACVQERDDLQKPDLSCLMCGHAKERGTYSATKGCFICVDCVYQHSEYINMVNLAAQERGRAIQAEAAVRAAEVLRGTLQPYLQHKPECDMDDCLCGHWLGNHNDGVCDRRGCKCKGFQPKPCTCGLAALLATP